MENFIIFLGQSFTPVRPGSTGRSRIPKVSAKGWRWFDTLSLISEVQAES
jgi:hypothetical protein